MKISLFIFIISISFWTCKTKPEKVGRGFYNDILEDFVLHHSYATLLNESEYENIYGKYKPIAENAKSNEQFDEVKRQMDREIDILVERKFSKNVPKCYLELSEKYKLQFNRWATFYKLPFKSEFKKKDSVIILKTLTTPLSNNLRSVHSPFFRIGTVPTDSCKLGKVMFSEPYFNKEKNKGLIFCIYNHNHMGYSKVFLLIKEGSYWFIKDEEQISIS